MSAERAQRHHEYVGQYYVPDTGTTVLVDLHSTKLGAAIGGTRLKWYPSLEAAREDVHRLAAAMTNKCALAGLRLGGGKAVIPYFSEEEGKAWTDPIIRAARLQAYARIIDSLQGRFITAEDANTTPADMAFMRHFTPYVVGLPRANGGGGDPAPITTQGVLHAMRAVAEEVLHTDSLKGVRFAIQGLGNIGRRLATRLVAEGASVVATDLRSEVAREVAQALGITLVEPEAIYGVKCDIFSPCAYGGVLNATTIPLLNCAAVVGCANNQLDREDDGESLHARGVVYAVDYVVNAGGLINCAQELELGGYDEEPVQHKTAAIYATTKRVLRVAHEREISTQAAASELAREILFQ